MIGFVKSDHKCLKPSFLLSSIPSLILCDEKLLTPSELQKQPQIAIIDYV